jgi:hypothetical protein
MTVLGVHPALGSARRWWLGWQLNCRPIGVEAERTISAAELAVLVVLGFASAVASAVLTRDLGIPGHSILRVVLPMAPGLALVPRRGSASIMGLSAGAGGAVFWLSGVHNFGVGAVTSLVLTGFLLDLAMIGARSGRSVYFRLALAGLASNLLAFAAKLAEKLLSPEAMGRQPFGSWLLKSLVSYPACGFLAGLIGAAACFRFTKTPQAP